MPDLLDLCLEILEEIVTKLESVEDVISLGSSYTHLARIVGQERIWRVMIPKTELVEGADPALIYIADIGENVKGKLQVYVDDTKLKKPIETESDVENLQEDLECLYAWETI